MTEGLSAIGQYGGLGSAGLYGSYYNNPMMSMMGGYGNYGMMNPMMSMMGGYYNPEMMTQYTEMMKQMYNAQNEIQKLSLQNAVSMHGAKEEAQVTNAKVHDRAFFETVAVNGDVQNAVREIYDAIRRGDMDYVTHKYFELKEIILNKYSEHFNNSIGGINDRENIDHFISTLYSEIGSGYNPGGAKPDLRADILAYGETAFEHGANTTFLGNSGHNKKTAEDCLYEIHGTRVNDAGSKAKAEKMGQYWGRTKEGLCAAGIGAVGGAAALGIAKTLPFGINKPFITNPATGKAAFGGLGRWAWLGAISLGVADIFWQMGRA